MEFFLGMIIFFFLLRYSVGYFLNFYLSSKDKKELEYGQNRVKSYLSELYTKYFQYLKEVRKPSIPYFEDYFWKIIYSFERKVLNNFSKSVGLDFSRYLVIYPEILFLLIFFIEIWLQQGFWFTLYAWGIRILIVRVFFWYNYEIDIIRRSRVSSMFRDVGDVWNRLYICRYGYYYINGNALR